MFWKAKASVFTHLEAYLKARDLAFAKLPLPELPMESVVAKCEIRVATTQDCQGISKLLNEWFDKDKVKTTTTPEWIRSTFLDEQAIWIIAKDSGGTVRACISSFRIAAPYPNALSRCGEMHPWGIVDWFCVHPLWRGKGIASNLLETLDHITYNLGRKAHVFLKEGTPLLQLPVYATTLKCRRAGTPKVTRMREGTGLGVYDYHCSERTTGLPMIRLEGLDNIDDLDAWENALDTELPECWVFINGSAPVDMRKGWKPDSLVTMYAFRWVPGKWLGKKPHQDII